MLVQNDDPRQSIKNAYGNKKNSIPTVRLFPPEQITESQINYTKDDQNFVRQP